MFPNRPALRFALTARPTASQGEAPARAIRKHGIWGETTPETGEPISIWRRAKGDLPPLGDGVHTKDLTRGACTELDPVYRRLLKMMLEELRRIEPPIEKLDQEIATRLNPGQDAVQRLAEVPGLGVDSAQQIIAEVGATAAAFPSAKQLSSWVGACPGEEESAGVNQSHRSPQGNRPMRRILNPAANAAVQHKGSIFEIVYRRLQRRLGHGHTIGAIAHRLCRLIWIILHQGGPL